MSAAAARLPVLDADDMGIEPTVRADFNFGQVTLPVPPAAAMVVPNPSSAVKAYPRTPTPTPNPSSQRAHGTTTVVMPPPPSAKRSLAIGFVLGTTLGLALVGAGWHFFL